jgi:hypothetical protein
MLSLFLLILPLRLQPLQDLSHLAGKGIDGFPFIHAQAPFGSELALQSVFEYSFRLPDRAIIACLNLTEYEL